jgi:hypothetical protein
MWAARFVKRLEQLLLGGEPINTSIAVPNDGDRLVDDGVTDEEWKPTAVDEAEPVLMFQVEISADIGRVGTNWKGVSWGTPTRIDTDAFTLESDATTITFEEPGDYFIWTTLTSFFQNNNSIAYVGIALYNGSDFELIPETERRMHTAEANVQVSLLGYHHEASTGDQIKVIGKFSGSDPTAFFKNNMTNIFIQMVPE